MEQVVKTKFHERIQNTLMGYLPQLSGSQLKCFQIISHLTTRVGIREVALSLDQFEALTGLSRKTVVNSLKELSSFNLVEIDTETRINKYSVRRDKFKQLEKTGSDQEKILNSVINEHQRMEKLHFEDLGFPLETKKIFDLWNTYIYKWLDITNEMHVKCVKGYLKTVSIEKLLNRISNMINTVDLENTVFDDSVIVELFEFKGD